MNVSPRQPLNVRIMAIILDDAMFNTSRSGGERQKDFRVNSEALLEKQARAAYGIIIMQRKGTAAHYAIQQHCWDCEETSIT